MWIYVAAFLLALGFLAAAGGLFLQKKRNKRELQQISLCLGRLLEGKKPEDRNMEQDTLDSKIRHQLFQIQNRNQAYLEKVEQERDSIQKLITEIAHQLRNPLTNMESYLEFLKEDCSREERETYIRALEISEQKIHFLTESFMKMSRLENGMIQIRKEERDGILTLSQAAQAIEKQDRAKGVQLVLDLPQSLDFPHDGNWLSEAVMNLLDNSIKYSYPKGQVVLGAEKNQMFVRIWVRDWGIGIAGEEVSRLFQRFYRGKNAGKQEGFGIGLYLTREIVLLHQGFVRIKAEEKGTLAEIYLSCSIGNFFEFPIEQKALRAGAHCGGEELCR